MGTLVNALPQNINEKSRDNFAVILLCIITYVGQTSCKSIIYITSMTTTTTTAYDKDGISFRLRATSVQRDDASKRSRLRRSERKLSSYSSCTMPSLGNLLLSNLTAFPSHITVSPTFSLSPITSEVPFTTTWPVASRRQPNVFNLLGGAPIAVWTCEGQEVQIQVAMHAKATPAMTSINYLGIELHVLHPYCSRTALVPGRRKFALAASH
jgi:hypothetical protein